MLFVTDPDPLDLRQLEHALRADDPAFLRAFDAAAAGLVHAFRWRAFPDEHGRAGMHDLDGQEAAQGVARRAVELATVVAPAVTVDARVVSRSAAAAVVGQAAGGRLVVLGAGQRTASRTALALSTLARVTASVTGPVVVVPPVEDVRSALSGRPVVVHLDGGPTSAAVLGLALEVARSQAAPVHVLCSPDARDRVGELLAGPGRWAVVGLSNNPRRVALGVSRFLLERLGKDIVPVSLKGDDVHGQKGYVSLAEVPGPIDVVDCFVNSQRVGAVVDQAIAVGAKAVWLQQGVIDEAAAQRAKDAGLDVVMDACPVLEAPRLGL